MFVARWRLVNTRTATGPSGVCCTTMPQFTVADDRHPLLGDDHPGEGVQLGNGIHVETRCADRRVRRGYHGVDGRGLELCFVRVQWLRTHAAGAGTRG